MTNPLFIVNNRYEINPALNLVKDRVLQKETRIEQRLMSILCFLAEHKEELVTREVLIKEIWNDYGGADEGLTQSVSALRKILNDTKKEIIETVPKKGYFLHTDNTVEHDDSINDRSRKKMNKKFVFSIAVVAIIVAVGLFFYLPNSSKNNNDQRLENLKDTSVPFNEVNKASEENYLNTITTTGPDSVQYKLVSIGDRKPLFYINQQLVSEDEMEKYLSLISEMKKQLQKKREIADKKRN